MNNPLLVTMRGPGDFNLGDVSDFEAGIIVLSELNKMQPGITWGELFSMGRINGSGTMGRGFWERQAKRAGGAVMTVARGTGGAVMDVARGAGGVAMDIQRSGGDIVMSAVNAVGDKVGEATRLFTDQKVVEGGAKAYKAFTDGGGIAGFWGGSGVFGKGGGEGATDEEGMSAAGGIWDFITSLGSSAKKKTGANEAGIFGIPSNVLPWAIAGGAVLVVLFARPGHHK
jgi:hypothetical protein